MKKNEQKVIKLGKALRYIRKASSLTERGMARCLNISFEEVKDYEAGKQVIHFIDYLRWVSVLVQSRSVWNTSKRKRM